MFWEIVEVSSTLLSLVPSVVTWPNILLVNFNDVVSGVSVSTLLYKTNNLCEGKEKNIGITHNTIF